MDDHRRAYAPAERRRKIHPYASATSKASRVVLHNAGASAAPRGTKTTMRSGALPPGRLRSVEAPCPGSRSSPFLFLKQRASSYPSTYSPTTLSLAFAVISHAAGPSSEPALGSLEVFGNTLDSQLATHIPPPACRDLMTKVWTATSKEAIDEHAVPDGRLHAHRPSGRNLCPHPVSQVSRATPRAASTADSSRQASGCTRASWNGAAAGSVCGDSHTAALTLAAASCSSPLPSLRHSRLRHRSHLPPPPCSPPPSPPPCPSPPSAAPPSTTPRSLSLPLPSSPPSRARPRPARRHRRRRHPQRRSPRHCQHPRSISPPPPSPTLAPGGDVRLPR